MKLTHLGHACVLLEIGGTRLLFDPGTFSSFEDIDGLDAVLVTHQHADHIDAPRVDALLAANPSAKLVVDVDSASAISGLPEPYLVAEPGARFDIGGTTVDVLGGLHAAVYKDVPGCSNAAYLVDDGAFLHPGDSFFVPEQEVDVLMVAIDGPWLKLSEAVDYVRAVGPRVAVPMHEGETNDPHKYAGMLGAFSPDGVVKPVPRSESVAL